MPLLDLAFYIDWDPTESTIQNGLVFGRASADEDTHTPEKLIVVTDATKIRGNRQKVNALLMNLAADPESEQELRRYGVQQVGIEEVTAESRVAWHDAIRVINETFAARNKDLGDRRLRV